MKNKQIIVSTIVVVVAILLGAFLMHRRVAAPVVSTGADNKTVVFSCDNSKQLSVSFPAQNDQSLDLTLSDGRTMTLGYIETADGARYANADQSIALWNQDNDVFLNE